MKQWVRTTRTQFCGSCGRLLVSGEVVQSIHVRGLARALARCEACAGEPADYTDVETPKGESSRVTVMQRLSEILPPSFDRKAAAAGRDE